MTFADLRIRRRWRRRLQCLCFRGWSGFLKFHGPRWKAFAGQQGLDWEARSDWIDTGYGCAGVSSANAAAGSVAVCGRGSQAGEILRVQLPDGLVLVNDQLTTFL